ncbi:MAG: type II secretion system F family protein [Propionibacteriaceae bacterium]
MNVVAALCASFASWLIAKSENNCDRLSASATTSVRSRYWLWVLVILGISSLAIFVLLPVGRLRVLGVVAAEIAMVAVIFIHGWKAERCARRRRDEVARSCWELAGEVTAGRVPFEALKIVANDIPVMKKAAGIAELGGDIPACWREQAQISGYEGLLTLARAWEVSVKTGAPMAGSLRGVAESIRDRRRLSNTVAGELAAPRATGRLLVCLPALGVALGFAFGGNPLQFLLETLVGQLCLISAVALAGTGLLWSERQASKAVVS